MEQKRIQKILVLSPHPDDAEFGCGGSIHRWTKKENREVHVKYFSKCMGSANNNDFDIHNESVQAMKKLGGIHRGIFNYFVREFQMQRQSILDDMIKLRDEIKPDLVLVPNSNDVHQDHATIYQESLRAFKFSNILGWEMIWNNVKNIDANYFMKLSEDDIKAKTRAIKCYKSQANRFYATDEYLKSMAVLRGTQINHKYAEAFELIRWIH